MRKFRVFFQDNSGIKCEEFECKGIQFKDKWLILLGESLISSVEDAPDVNRIVIAIPTDMIYYVEEISDAS